MVKKIACAHDWLVFLGGADSVFFTMIEQEIEKNPDALFRVFTLVSRDKKLKINGKNIPVTTALPSFLNKRFIYRTDYKDKAKNPISKLRARLWNYRNLIVFYPLLQWRQSRAIRRYNPDKAIISSANISKNLTFPKHTYTVVYFHSVLMYVQPMFKEFYDKFNVPTRILLSIITPWLRYRDKRFTHFDSIWANSQYTAKTIQQIYGIKSQTAYPPISSIDIFLQQPIIPKTKKKDYYIYVGRLVRSLRDVDKMILAFNQLKENLIIIGSGSDEKYLRSIAGPHITFLGQCDDRKQIIDYIQHAKGYINLAYESAGMSNIEAMLLGIPILGYNKGGTAELVDPHSGHLLEHKDIQSIIKGFQKFQKKKFDNLYIQKRMQKIVKTQGWEIYKKNIQKL